MNLQYEAAKNELEYHIAKAIEAAKIIQECSDNEDDGCLLAIQLTKSESKALENYSQVTGEIMGDAAYKWIQEKLYHYRGEMVPATYISDGGEKPCFYMGDCQIFGQDYRQIAVDGAFVKAPAECVVLDNER